MAEWSLAAVHDVVAAAVPDRTMVICGDRRQTFAEVHDRSRGLAAHLRGSGLGLRRERGGLERWESGQDSVALVLHNGTEYLEALLGCVRARTVPFNVNQHYRPAELSALLGDLDARGIVYHRRYGPRLAEAVDTAALVLVDVDDGSGVAPLVGSTPYEDAVATVAVDLPTTSPDDLYVVCTGGTTGRPKAVLWRQGDAFPGALGGSADATADSLAAAAVANPANPWYAMPPLMHAAAQWTALSAVFAGAPVLLHDDSGPFDPAAVLSSAEHHRAHLMSMVGDAHARPIVEELRRHPYDLAALTVVGTGGAVTSEPVKAALLDLLPHVVVVDGYGSSESGTVAFGPRSAAGGGASFQPNAGATVVSADRTRELEPGDEEIGWIARRGAVPLGYLGDPAASATTFPEVAGRRMTVPGDRGRRLADGSIELLGRDSTVINTGGEKVFAEEVETTLVAHPDIVDALVVGRPSARFGEEVVALVELRPGATPDPAGVRDFVADRIARFKAPRALLVCDVVRRHANGKADYRWARSVAGDAVAVGATDAVAGDGPAA